MQDKLIRLRAILSEMGSVAVAYSGGTDSALVLAVAHDALGDRALALTADSPSVPRAELEAARAVAAGLGVQHVVLPTAELDDPAYRANTPTAAISARATTWMSCWPMRWRTAIPAWWTAPTPTTWAITGPVRMPRASGASAARCKKSA